MVFSSSMGTSSSVPSSYSDAVSSDSGVREERPRMGLPGSEEVRYEVTRLVVHTEGPCSESESSECESANEDVGVALRASASSLDPRARRLVMARNTGPKAPKSGASTRN